MFGVLVVACAGGAALGALNGSLVAYLRLPSIVVTLATMVALRDALRWTTEGAWVQDLPAGFQWFGLSQTAYPILALLVSVGLLVLMAWGSANLAAGRAIYATGSNPDAARLAGFDTSRVKWAVFTTAGALTGLAAVLNSVRFNQIPSNAGLGLEMKVDCGGGRRRHRDSRGTRNVRRHAARRHPARRDWSGPHVSRRERVLGARAAGRDHPCSRRDRRMAGSTGHSHAPGWRGSARLMAPPQ